MVNGVVCSTNSIAGLIKPKGIALDCFTKVRANTEF